MPGVLDFFALHGNFQRIALGECLHVGVHNLATAALKAIQLVQLAQADGGGNVRHVVLEARSEDLVAPTPALRVAPPGIATHPVQADDPRFLDELAVSGEHPAFTGREILGRVKAERDGIWSRADVHALVFRRQPVRGILDERKVVLPRDFPEPLELGRMPA